MSKNATTNDVVTSLAKAMATSPKTVLYIVGLTNNSLSMAVHKPFKDLALTKFGQRIIKLAKVREFLVKEHNADKYELIFCFTAPAYRNAKNIILDFSTALQKDIYSKEVLCEIALTALKVCRYEVNSPIKSKNPIPKDVKASFEKSWNLVKENLLKNIQDETEKEKVKEIAYSVFMSGMNTYESSPDEVIQESYRDKVKNTETNEKFRQWWEKLAVKDPNPQIVFTKAYNMGRIDGIHECEEKEKDSEETI